MYSIKLSFNDVSNFIEFETPNDSGLWFDYCNKSKMVSRKYELWRQNGVFFAKDRKTDEIVLATPTIRPLLDEMYNVIKGV